MNYNFLEIFQSLRFIKDESIPRSIIQRSLESLSSDQFRSIISLGVAAHFSKTKDFDVISTLHGNLKQDASINVARDNNNTDGRNANINTIKVFSIEDLVCNIFQYLNLKSLIQCRNVNVNWLYCSYNPSSIYRLNISELCKNVRIETDRRRYRERELREYQLRASSYKHSHGTWQYFYHGCNILDYKNVSRIKLREWDKTVHYYFQHLAKFNNIREIEIDSHYLSQRTKEFHYQDTVSSMIKNNANKIEAIKIREHVATNNYRLIDYDENVNEMSTIMKTFSKQVKLINLKELDISDSVIHRFSCLSNKENKFERISLRNVYTSQLFWCDLSIFHSSYLSNLRKMVFVTHQLSERNNDDTIYKEIRSMIVKHLGIIILKLENLKWFTRFDFISDILNALSKNDKVMSKNGQIVSFDNLETLEFKFLLSQTKDGGVDITSEKFINCIRFPRLKQVGIWFDKRLNFKRGQLGALLKILLQTEKGSGDSDSGIDTDCLDKTKNNNDTNNQNNGKIVNNTIENMKFTWCHHDKTLPCVDELFNTLSGVNLAQLKTFEIHQSQDDLCKSQESMLKDVVNVLELMDKFVQRDKIKMKKCGSKSSKPYLHLNLTFRVDLATNEPDNDTVEKLIHIFEKWCGKNRIGNNINVEISIQTTFGSGLLFPFKRAWDPKLSNTEWLVLFCNSMAGPRSSYLNGYQYQIKRGFRAEKRFYWANTSQTNFPFNPFQRHTTLNSKVHIIMEVDGQLSIHFNT